jgi:hypothetical protein
MLSEVYEIEVDPALLVYLTDLMHPLFWNPESFG